MSEEKSKTKAKVQPKVAEETAEAEFEQFAETWDVDINERGMDDEDRKGFYESKRHFIKAMLRGRLVLDENSVATYSPIDGSEPLTFCEAEGSFFTSTDQKKRDHIVGKMHVLIARMTKTDQKRIEKLKQRDYKVVQAIALLLLA